MMDRRIVATFAVAAAVCGASAATAVATPPGRNGQIVWQQESFARPPQIWVANPDGSAARQVVAEDQAATFEAAFSPASASSLAFTRGTPEPFSEEIFVSDLVTGQKRQVTNSRNASVAPAFSPDGTRMVFFSVRPPGRNHPPGPERIAVIGVDGTGLKYLTPQNRSSIDPDYSPDGTMIAYGESRPGGYSGDNRLMVMNADGSHRRAVTPYGGRREINPKWLPDGSGLVFESLDRRSRKSDIERVALDGSARRTVLATSAFETNPVPSPDGTRIAFTSDRDRRGPTRLGPGTEVYTMKLDGTDIVRLTTNQAPDLFPDWQRLP